MKAFAAAFALLSAPVITFAEDTGQVLLSNRLGGTVNAPIFLPTGEAAGLMENIVVQLFLEDSGELTPLQPRSGFRFPTATVPIVPAYFVPQMVDIPHSPAGTEANLRLRVWESIDACSYDFARTKGYYYGEVSVTVKTGGGPTPPTALTGLHGLILGGSEKSGRKEGVITFLVEVADAGSGSTNWTPLATLQSTNQSPVEIPTFPSSASSCYSEELRTGSENGLERRQ